MTKLCFLFSLTSALFGQILGPYQASTNFAFDLQGVVDTRPYTYGYTDSQSKTVKFNPPAHYQTRIMSVSGDLIFAPEFVGAIAVKAPPSGTGTYVLFGLNKTVTTSSGRCTPCDDNSMVTLQGTWPGPGRLAFERDIHVNGVLGTDNELVLKVATFFNTTGNYIHIEPTLNITYQFEPIQ